MPDATVGGDASMEGGALFSIGLGKSRFTYTTPDGLGGRLFLDGKKVVDAWEAGKSTTSKPFTLVRGKPVKVVLEYYQKNTDGNPRCVRVRVHNM
eukprot:SAG22_NODE_764_length_7397_cov_6.955604_9_plen_95_part_00